MPSRVSSAIASTLMVGFNHMVFAELLRRARCRSRSGVRPSKARAPSNTLEPSQKACVRGPTIALLPSNHSPSRKVWVRDQSAMGRTRDLDAKEARGIRHRPLSGPDKGESHGFLVRVDGRAGRDGLFRGAQMTRSLSLSGLRHRDPRG